jgi:hypothetical protein
MKILYVTFTIPSEKYGGGLVVLQTLNSISQYADIDYVGVDYDENDFEKYDIKIERKINCTPCQGHFEFD